MSEIKAGQMVWSRFIDDDEWDTGKYEYVGEKQGREYIIFMGRTVQVRAVIGVDPFGVNKEIGE